MAEALRTDKAGERPNAIYTAYLKKPVEVAKALKVLRNQGATVKLTFENEPTLCSARILDVLDAELLLEDIQPRSALKLMTARRRFAFSSRSDGIYLYSEDNRVSRIDEDRGVPYFRVPFPREVLFQQRRRATRYQVPCRTGAKPATVTLYRMVAGDKDHGDTLEGQLLDISAGGCRLAIPGPVHPPLSSDESLRGIVIRVPSMFDLNVDALVRHASYNKDSRKVICGLEFTGMDITDRRRLGQFIQSLSRDRV